MVLIVKALKMIQSMVSAILNYIIVDENWTNVNVVNVMEGVVQIMGAHVKLVLTISS